jgi:hypothetical protein
MPLPLVDSVSDHRWRHRVVVVFSQSDDARLARQVSLLKNPGTPERDLILVRGTEALRKRLRVGGGAFRVALVGKDGTVQLQSARPFPRERLYAVIDAMPMRRAEMRRKGHNR